MIQTFWTIACHCILGPHRKKTIEFSTIRTIWFLDPLHMWGKAQICKYMQVLRKLLRNVVFFRPSIQHNDLFEIWVQSRLLVVTWYSSVRFTCYWGKKRYKERNMSIQSKLSETNRRISKAKCLKQFQGNIYGKKEHKEDRMRLINHKQNCKWKNITFLLSSLTVYLLSCLY